MRIYYTLLAAAFILAVMGVRGFIPAVNGAKALHLEVLGEEEGENPKMCNAFDDESSRTDLPCCYVAESDDQVPSYLRRFVRLNKTDETISIYYNADLKMVHQVLIPLVSPKKHQIEFTLSATFPDGSNCQEQQDDRVSPYLKKRSARGRFNKYLHGSGQSQMEYFNRSSFANDDQVFADEEAHRSGLVRQIVNILDPLTIAYGRYPDGEEPMDGSRLCRSFIQTSPELLDDSPPTIKIRIMHDPVRPSYTFTEGTVQKQRENNRMMCPVELREWKGFGYYLPFRIMRPEVVGYQREDTIKGIPLKQFIGEYAHLRCAFTLKFGKSYRLLVPTPPSPTEEAPSTSTMASTEGYNQN